MSLTPPRLITALRVFFGVFRILCAICLAVVPLGLLPFGSVHVHGTIFSPMSASVFQVPASGPVRPTIRVESAYVSIEGNREDAELSRLARFVQTPVYAFAAAVLLTCTHLLWRLCRNVEKREVFCSANVGVLQRLGWTMVALAAGLSILSLWQDHAVAAYIAKHTAGLVLASVTTGSVVRHLQITTAVLGLLTLVLTEIFRYGLALKRDTEFTV